MSLHKVNISIYASVFKIKIHHFSKFIILIKRKMKFVLALATIAAFASAKDLQLTSQLDYQYM